RQAVLREVPWVALGGIRAPEDDQVAPILDLAQSTGHLADILEGDPRGPLAHARRGIEAASDPVGDRHHPALVFARGATQAVDDRILRLYQDLGGALNPVGDRGRPSLDQAGRAFLVLMTEEPRFSEDAGAFRLGDPITLHLQRYVITHAATEC